jgi:Domain of unknown function (DUF4037)
MNPQVIPTEHRMPDFIPGLNLGERFYHEAIKPILESRFPLLRHTAALIGPGSEVLGFDTPMSTDHHWGPRAMLFLSEADFAQRRDEMREVFARELPRTFCGYPTNFTPSDDHGVQLLHASENGPINHRLEIMTIAGFFREYLDVDPYGLLDAADWLTFPQQKLRTITAGAVYHDDLALAELRQKFSFYPHDVWLYQLAAVWGGIAQEEAFVGRAGEAGDELGSAIIAARLVGHMMHLCFLMERQYQPYSKWLGTAFSKLQCAVALLPMFNRLFAAQTWQQREKALTEAYEFLALMHAQLKTTPPLPTQVSNFHDRPFQVIHADMFATAIRDQISDEKIRRIRTNIGGVNVFSNSTDLLEATHLRQRLKSLYTQSPDS